MSRPSSLSASFLRRQEAGREGYGPVWDWKGLYWQPMWEGLEGEVGGPQEAREQAKGWERTK